MEPVATPYIPPSRLASARTMQTRLLELLEFKSMTYREQDVGNVHEPRTFEWIWEEIKPSASPSVKAQFTQVFPKWLSSNDYGPLYWITGEPGSGKSTLINFIAQHEKTKQHLKTWAANPVLIATFFFWSAGNAQQRSLEGLLRSLLHQLLSAKPKVIPNVFPDLWTKVAAMTTKQALTFKKEWTSLELHVAFEEFLKVVCDQDQNHICLFVDGIDEVDKNNLDQTTRFLKDLAHKRDRIKICAASRPYIQFLDKTEVSTRLQDITREDMLAYMRHRFSSTNWISKLSGEFDQLNTLFDGILTKSDGVFLWTRLAVQQLLSPKIATLEALTTKLEDLPQGLDNLFKYIVFQQNKSEEITRAAELLRLMEARSEVATDINDTDTSPTLWDIVFAFRGQREIGDKVDSEFYDVDKFYVPSASETSHQCQITLREIDRRTGGLLQLRARRKPILRTRFVTDEAETALLDQKIAYAHRTVLDWVHSSETWDRIKEITDHFNPHLRLLESYVLQLSRPLEPVIPDRDTDARHHEIAVALTHARYINDAKTDHRLFVNKLDEVISEHYWQAKPWDPYDHWARNLFGIYEKRCKLPPMRYPFLCMAAKYGLTDYLWYELLDGEKYKDSALDYPELDEGAENQPTPLISYATEYLCSRNHSNFPLSDPSLVGLIVTLKSPFNYGVDYQYKDYETMQITTPWIALLRTLRTAHRRGWLEERDWSAARKRRLARIIWEFVVVGNADIQAVIEKDEWDPRITALEVVDMVQAKCPSDDLHGVIKIMKMRLEAFNS